MAGDSWGDSWEVTVGQDRYKPQVVGTKKYHYKIKTGITINRRITLYIGVRYSIILTKMKKTSLLVAALAVAANAISTQPTPMRLA